MELSPNGELIDKKPILTAEGLIQTTNAISSPTTTLTATNLDIDILPVIYDIIRCVEKDPKDNTAKQRESQECSQKILELQKRFESVRAQIRLLPGIDYNKEEQLQKLELLKNQLKLKQQLILMILRMLMRYLANNEQLINRMAESYPMRRAAQIVVSFMYRAKHVAENKGLHEMTPKRFKSFMKVFKGNINEEIEGVKEKLKRK